MAFALTRLSAYGVSIGTTTRKRDIQRVEIRLTALAADVDVDIANSGSQFWTDVTGNATYGAMGTLAKEFLLGLSSTCRSLLAIKCQEILERVQVDTLTANGQYLVTTTGVLPRIRFFAGNGETAMDIVLEFQGKDEQPVQVLELGYD